MKKPTLKDYCITEEDLTKSKRIKFILKIIVIIICIVDLILLGFGRTIFNSKYIIYFLFIGVPPCGPILIYFVLKWIIKNVSFSFNNSVRFETDSYKYEQWWLRTQEKYWFSLSGRRFENELAELFKKLGYAVEVTSHSDDKGVDIWLYGNSQRIPVQCKAHKRPVGPAIAREFYGAMKHFKSNYGILASLSGFTKGVREYTKGKPIELININWILDKQKTLEEGNE